MRQRMALGVGAVVMALSLSACFPTTRWIKPGATTSDWEQTKASCMLEGAEKAPIVPVYTMRPGTAKTTRQCDKDGRTCTTTETVTPPSYTQSDANAALREQVVRGCYARRGWVEVEVQDE